MQLAELAKGQKETAPMPTEQELHEATPGGLDPSMTKKKPDKGDDGESRADGNYVPINQKKNGEIKKSV